LCSPFIDNHDLMKCGEIQCLPPTYNHKYAERGEHKVRPYSNTSIRFMTF
jgi:hypothetical protein